MNFTYQRQLHPSVTELEHFFATAFGESSSQTVIAAGDIQPLGEWFSVTNMIQDVNHGHLIEARDTSNVLIGVLFIAKQNPITWPDGHKAEIFILAVDAGFRRLGVARHLMAEAEAAAKEMGALKLVFNTNLDYSEENFFTKLGYKKIGRLEDWYANGTATFYAKNVGTADSM